MTTTGATGIFDRERRKATPSGASSRVVAPSTERMRGMLLVGKGGGARRAGRESEKWGSRRDWIFFSWQRQFGRKKKEKEGKRCPPHSDRKRQNSRFSDPGGDRSGHSRGPCGRIDGCRAAAGAEEEDAESDCGRTTIEATSTPSPLPKHLLFCRRL